MGESRFETIRGGWRSILTIGWEIFKFRLSVIDAYTTSLLLRPFEIVLSVLVFIYISLFIEPMVSPYIQEYGGSYPKYIIAGAVGEPFLFLPLYFFYEYLRDYYWGNLSTIYESSPEGLKGYFLGGFMFSALFMSLNTLVYLIVSLYLGVALSLQAMFRFGVVMAVGMASMLGLGLIGASTFTLLDAKRGDPVSWVLHHLTNIASGLYIPLEVMPAWLRGIGMFIPSTHAFRAFRLIILENYSLASPAIIGCMEILLVYAAVTIPAGALLFKKSLEKARSEGTFARWT